MSDDLKNRPPSVAAEKSMVLRVPRGSLDASQPPLEFNMSLVYSAEDRLVETENANVYTANPLAALFNMASCQAATYSKKVLYELSKAKTLLKRREADLLIDEWPQFMESKKINDSAGMRDAFLTKDKTYSDLVDRIDLLTAMESFLKEKKDVFVRAYQQLKQLYAGEKRDPMYYKGDHNG